MRNIQTNFANLLPIKHIISIKKESFVYSKFNYVHSSTYLQSKSHYKNIENIKKRALENLHDDFESECSELLQKSNKTIMTTQRLRSICLEIYETLNQLNSEFMLNIFKLSSSNRAARKQYLLNLENIRPHEVKFSEKNLRALGCKNMEQSPTTYQVCSKSYNL